MANLHDACVPVFDATLDNLSVMLGRASAHCADRNIDPDALLQARLFPDMFPLTRDELVSQDLAHTNVEITTVPIGRPVDAIPAVREEGDVTIFPVMEEVLVIERRLMLKEEVHIRKVRTTERHQETVTLRYQEAVVSRNSETPPDADAGKPASAGQ